MKPNLNLKLADAQQVTTTMIEAMRTSQWFAGGMHHQFAPNLVRDIQAALTDLGIVMFQLDNAGTLPACECGWSPQPGLIGGQTLEEHQRFCKAHADARDGTK